MRFLTQSPALIEAWFDLLPPARREAVRELRDAVLHAAPQLMQTIKWGHLVFTLDGSHAFAIAPFKANLHLQVFRGAGLQREFQALEGSSKGLRHLKWRYSHSLDRAQVDDIVRAAVALMHAQPRERRGSHAEPYASSEARREAPLASAPPRFTPTTRPPRLHEPGRSAHDADERHGGAAREPKPRDPLLR